MTFEEKQNTVYAVLREYYVKHGRVLATMDGHCAAGKTTLANALQARFNADGMTCAVIHMDHFFLRPEQRSAARLARAGENVDHERFFEEVIRPYIEGKRISYRPYDCKTQTLDEEIHISNADVILVEGSYSCHSQLREHYDIRIFLDVEKEEQAARIKARNGDGASAFFETWIPLEEAYFTACGVQNACELVLK